MEALRTIIDRLFIFVATLVPGGAAFLLLTLAYPNLLARFWNLGLDTQTKIGAASALAFILGWSIVVPFGHLLGAIGGFISSFLGSMESRKLDVMPWRSVGWRSLLTSYLKGAAPENIQPVPDEVFQAQLAIIDRMSEPYRTSRMVEAYVEKGKADLNDLEWRAWWHDLHYQITLNPGDPVTAMAQQLTHSFQAASVVILFGTLFFPVLRHWWVFVLCFSWLLELILYAAGLYLSLRNPWSSSLKQMKYLQDRLDEGTSPKGPTSPE